MPDNPTVPLAVSPGANRFALQIADRVVATLAKHRIDYVIIGQAGAILQGFPEYTQDIDILPRSASGNLKRLVKALKELGFVIDEKTAVGIARGKLKFIILRNGPFGLDVINSFYRSYSEVKRDAVMVDGKYPIASLSDIIRSKEIADREKDRRVLPALKQFAEYKNIRDKKT